MSAAFDDGGKEMGETYSWQPLITLKGEYRASKVRNIVQPAQGWGDAKDFRDAIFHVNILRLDGSPTGAEARWPRLIIQTAVSPAGPWKDLATFGGAALTAPENTVVGASTGAPLYEPTSPPYVYFLERFFRWKVDVSTLTQTSPSNDTWAICFGIGVVLK